MTFANNKKRNAMIIGAIVFSIGITTSMLFSYDSVIAEQSEQIPENSIGLTSTSDYLAQDGIRSLITISSDDVEVDVNKNQAFTTTFTITHEVNDINAEPVTLEARGIKGLYIPSSITSSAQQRADEFRDTGKITGAISFSDFVTFSPQTIVLNPGESETVSMKIIVPENTSAELLNKPLRFQPDIHRVGEYSHKIAIDNDSVNVRILES